ncbi:MAG: hypothetical protein Q8P90_00690 [bacterium]|nr:hypothetical protein [bacterium]
MKKINISRLANGKTLIPLILALISGMFLFLLGLLSSNWDWSISESIAEAIYIGFKDYQEFPFFTYFKNGGSMLIQDPQGHLLSIDTIWILMFGPQIGLRFAGFFWGFAGFYSMYHWLNKKIGFSPALLAASAWIISMGMFWRIILGNEMFLWHLGLPLFLIAIDKLLAKPSWRSSILTGLLLGMYILGPTFHSILYLILPVSLVWFIFLLIKNYQKISKLKVILHILTIILLGTLISSPKIYSWTQLDMSRQISTKPLSIDVDEAVLALIDINPLSITKVFNKEDNRDNAFFLGYGFFEGNVAFFPLANLLILIGLLIGWKKQIDKRHLYAFACSLLVIGILISSSDVIWSAFTSLTNNSFRASARFLSISGFGIAILSGIGLHYMTTKLKGKLKHASAIIAVASIFISALIWINAASKHTILVGEQKGNIVLPISELWQSDISRLQTDFTNIIRSHGMMFDTISVVGSGMDNVNDDYWDQFFIEKGEENFLSPELYPTNRLLITNTHAYAYNLNPHETVHIRVQPAPLGENVTTTPQNSNVTLEYGDGELILTNNEDFELAEVDISPNSPVHPATWYISVITFLLSAGYIIYVTVHPKENEKEK